MNIRYMVGKGLALLANILESCNPEVATAGAPVPVVPSEPLDFTKSRRGRGHNYNILDIHDKGAMLDLAMWSTPRPVAGQMLLLDNGGSPHALPNRRGPPRNWRQRHVVCNSKVRTPRGVQLNWLTPLLYLLGQMNNRRRTNAQVSIYG